MKRIVVTGASGLIGQAMIRELASRYDLVPIDRRRLDGSRAIPADLGRNLLASSWLPGRFRRPPRWARHFAGADAVLHLAASRSPRASWDQVLRDNIKATWNVLEAARSHGVRQVVYASSYHAVLGWQAETARWDACDPDLSPRPLSPYGLSKAWGELAGRMFVETGGLESFIAVRIGAYSPKPPADPVFAGRWVKPDEMAWILRRCLEADLKGFHLIDGVGDQPQSLARRARTVALLGPEGAG